MKLKLMDASTVSMAKLLGLVRGVRPVRIKGEKIRWALLVEGRGFTRLLRADVLPASPELIRPMGWNVPRPEVFVSTVHARRFIHSMGWGRPQRFEVIES